MKTEQERLRLVAQWYSNRTGFYSQLVVFGFRSLEPYFLPGNVLEMGSADGQMTELLEASFDDISVVDGSQEYVAAIRSRMPAVKAYASLFEDFDPPEAYENIVMAHILEHVEDPVAILRRAAAWLKPGGRIQIIVPNADSVHRLVALPAEDDQVRCRMVTLLKVFVMRVEKACRPTALLAVTVRT